MCAIALRQDTRCLGNGISEKIVPYGGWDYRTFSGSPGNRKTMAAQVIAKRASYGAI